MKLLIIAAMVLEISFISGQLSQYSGDKNAKTFEPPYTECSLNPNRCFDVNYTGKI